MSSIAQSGTKTSFPAEAKTNLNAKDYHIRIDLGGILPEKKQKPVIDLNPETEEKEMKQCQVLFDILDVGVDADIIEDIVKHPVITAMILKKWEKTRMFYYFTTALYALFLFSYSFLIYDLFGPNPDIEKDGVYYIEKCKDSIDKYKDEIETANFTSCQYRDPICNTGKCAHINT